MRVGVVAARARGRVRGMGAHLRTRNLTSSPVEQRQEEVDPVGLKVRGEGEAPTLPTVGSDMATFRTAKTHTAHTLGP